ncbi:MAG: hypothetical protein Q8936_22650 [Bacillota bacterium]|nr:hypothetical protein [Bacillota bacterium]
MISFENNKLNNFALPMSIVRMLTTINEYKGKKDLYKIWNKRFANVLSMDDVIKILLDN